MSQALWIQALKTVPKVNKEQWQTSNILTKWLVATRFSVTIMTFSSAFIGILLALSDGAIDVGLSILCIIGLMLAHATNNLINDLTDTIKGVDKGNYFRTEYGTHVLEHGLMTKKTLLVYIFVTGLLAILTGVAIVAMRGSDALLLMLSGAFFVLFYTWPLKKFSLGEVAVLLVWGPLMVGGTYLVSSGQWSNSAALIGALYALGPTTVIFGKHIDKLKMDKEKKIYSLPVLLGESLSRKIAQLMMLSPFVVGAYLFSIGVLNYGVLFLIIALPMMVTTMKVFAQPRPEIMPEGFRKEVWPLWYAPHAFVFTRRFSLAFLLMLVVEYFLAF
jgi:1,4-dihydroxy-2-naphthoate octaprenyltransferase